MLELSASDPIIKTYLKDIQHLKQDQLVAHELGLKGPFQDLLGHAAKRRGWTLVPELSTYSGGKRVVPDGTVRDEFRLARGWWEAKDTSDNLGAEIQKKLKAGYPTRNTIFEDTQTAVLYQDRAEAGEYTLREPVKVADLLNRFLSHEESDEREFQRAMDEFKNRIPDLAQSLRDHIEEAHKKNKNFKAAFTEFVALCRASLNPELSEANVDEMLIQHLLTVRLMRELFKNQDFTARNVIASQVEKVIRELASSSFSTAEFLKKLDPYYKAIEKAGANLSHFTEKQDFLNSVYEQFFQKFSPDVADTHGIVYTPREIVDYMCNSVEQALKEEFGYTLASPEVVILDPCTGTGNFIVNLIERMPGRTLAEAYHNRLFANEVMLLPYYVASLNIEHAYYERMNQYEVFEGLCFVDTLDMADARQIGLFTVANTERVEREKKAAITVIIGNPPYNVGQKNENDNNQNRKYKEVDGRVHNTYAKDSKASSKSKLDDAYVKFFRWATDRLEGRDGIVCFVSNNGFLDQVAFDGMRKHLAQDFLRVDHIDLHGNVRRNPKLSGTTHNVFGIQVGVGITLAVRKKGASQRLRYFRVPEMWRKGEKLEFLARGDVAWQTLKPDSEHTWLVPEHAEEYSGFLSLDSLFGLWSLGVNTARNAVAYDWNRDNLSARVRAFVADYNAEVHRHHADTSADWPDRIKWSEGLKLNVGRGNLAKFEAAKVVPALFRPFAKKWLYFDRIINERVYQWPKITGRVIWVKTGADWPFFALMSDLICDLLPQGGSQCFPLKHLRDFAVEQLRQHYSDDSITKEDAFHYIYALLHHTEYRERYAANLKRELPRIPFAPDFGAFATAGRELARLHVDYESLNVWPLEEIVNKGVPFSERVEKVKLSADKQSLRVNESLTLAGIPAETFEYRLGSRSALEWVIDQYQVKGESDPNREDDPGYIVRLVGQVVRVSVETVRIVKGLPGYR
ncbi:MAG TPA: type ISP restriction/modification enzyme [Bryobacteraceae bacterium]|nr:type ISP restriction/modification enzyme [Bryobacteraceae bacterium]